MKKKLLTGLAFGMLMAASTMAAAGQDDGGCKLQGSWMSIDNGVPTWVAGIHGQSASSGTDELEYPAFLSFPQDPDAVGGTHMRGVWERTGKNTFDYTMIGYAFDASGIPVWVNRMSGTKTLSEDCNTLTVTATANIFYCEDGVCPDPYGTTPYVQVSDPSTAFRIRLE